MVWKQLGDDNKDVSRKGAHTREGCSGRHRDGVVEALLPPQGSSLEGGGGSRGFG